MSLIRACARPGCQTLTIGEFCIDHDRCPALEPLAEPRSRGRVRRLHPHLAVATMLFVSAAAGVLVRSRLHH